jgi:hypothetical protein
MNTSTKNVGRIIFVTALILLIPLLAMQFTHEVAWTMLDFVTAAVLLIGTGLVYEFGVKKVRKFTYRTICAVALLFSFLLIWAELAVGIFS